MMENKVGTDHQEMDLLWGAAAIAKHLNLKNTRQAFHLLESGALPARKVGKSWVASRARLREHFSQVTAA